jgi:hypothetical protein
VRKGERSPGAELMYWRRNCRRLSNLVSGILREYGLSIESLGEPLSEQMKKLTGFAPPAACGFEGVYVSFSTRPRSVQAHYVARLCRMGPQATVTYTSEYYGDNCGGAQLRTELARTGVKGGFLE